MEEREYNAYVNKGLVKGFSTVDPSELGKTTVGSIKEISGEFSNLARAVNDLPNGPLKTMALEHLLIAKQAAVGTIVANANIG